MDTFFCFERTQMHRSAAQTDRFWDWE